jgi:LysM repeat protein
MINKLKSFRLLCPVMILLIFNNYTWSQVAVERSGDKVVISGIPYYIHLVKKGETAYSISRAYNITVEELTRENPQTVYGVKEGQSLRIPVRLVSASTTSQPPLLQQTKRDESKFIYHKLQPGETIYYLSKTYGVSENEIIQSNPGIDINKLPLGTEIAVPRKEFMNEKQKFVDQDTKSNYHKVVKGETLASIADKYGISVRELRRENRNIRFPQVGDYISIPGMKQVVVQVVEPINIDTVVVVSAEPVIMLERPSEYTQVNNLKGSLDIAVLLPFYLSENAQRTEIDSSKSVKGKKINKVINRTEDWIHPRSLGFVEMYEGILLAADTLRSLGLDIGLHVFDIKSDTVEITRLISSGKLDNMDLIIGPVHSRNLSILASYAGIRGIPVVSPVQLVNNSALINNPTLFMASSTLEVSQNALARKMSEYYNSNFVLYHTDSTGKDQDVRRFKNMILTELNYKLPYEEIKFKELVFYSRSVFGNDSINRLEHALSEKNGNVVIIASEDPPVMSETLTDVHTLSRKFNIKVFGYPDMRNLPNFDPKYLFDLGLMVYSPHWIDYSKQDVKQFNTDFRKKFFTEPSEISFAWQGYDIAYFFISGLAIHGKEFILHPEIHNPDLLQTEYDFRRKTMADGFENQKLFLIRYTNDYDVTLVNEEELVPAR